MKTHHFITVVIATWILNASLAFSCPMLDKVNELNLWVCDLNAEMTKRDKDADYTRSAALITSAPEIKQIRAALRIFDDETCRNFNQTSLITAFQRMLQHQSLPRSIMKEQTEVAAAKILSESSSSNIAVCESQTLATNVRDHTYQNLYYFKFGPVREQKHFIIRVTTKWQN